MKCEQSFSSEYLVPGIGRENIEEAHRRQDRARERLLNFNIMLDDRGILADADAAEAIHVSAVETFVETNTGEGRRGVKHAQRLESAPGLEKLRREPEEDAGDKDSADCGEHYGSTA